MIALRPVAARAILIRVLDSLSTTVAEERLARAANRHGRVQALAKLDIGLIGTHERGHMDQLGRLRLDRRNDLGWTVTHREDADAADQVDQRVAVDIGDQRTLSALDGEWCRLVESTQDSSSRRRTSSWLRGPGSAVTRLILLVEVVSIQHLPKSSSISAGRATASPEMQFRRAAPCRPMRI